VCVCVCIYIYIYIYIYFSACQYRDPNIYPSRVTLDRYYVNINQNSWHCDIAKLFILSPPLYNVFREKRLPFGEISRFTLRFPPRDNFFIRVVSHVRIKFILSPSYRDSSSFINPHLGNLHEMAKKKGGAKSTRAGGGL